MKIALKLLIILSFFYVLGFAGEGEQVVLKIEGDMCQKCADSLSTTLKNVEGVTAVKISLENKNAVIEHQKVTLAALQEAMTNAGYVVDKEKNSVKDYCNKEQCMGNQSCCQAGVESKK